MPWDWTIHRREATVLLVGAEAYQRSLTKALPTLSLQAAPGARISPYGLARERLSLLESAIRKLRRIQKE